MNRNLAVALAALGSWHVVDRIRHRNSDRDELARLLGGAQ